MEHNSQSVNIEGKTEQTPMGGGQLVDNKSRPQQGYPPTPIAPKPTHRLPKCAAIIIAIIAIMAAIGAVVVLMMSNNRQTISSSVCGNADINAYNDPILSELPFKDYAGDFDKLYNDIKNRPGNDQDATCQYLLYAIAYIRDDSATESHVDNVERLNKMGNYPNNKIYQLQDVKTMRKLSL